MLDQKAAAVCLGVESLQVKAACAELSDATNGHQHSSSTRLRAAALWPIQGGVVYSAGAFSVFVLVCAENVCLTRRLRRVCLGVESVQVTAACTELPDPTDGHQHSSSTRLRAAALPPILGGFLHVFGAVPLFVVVCAGSVCLGGDRTIDFGC
jgi:hypothetical protein